MTQPHDDYFSRFPDFDEDPEELLLVEFNRLALGQDWDKKTRAEERKNCLLAQLDVHIGIVEAAGQADQLARLQRLCAELRVKSIPTSITQCKKIPREIHVNLIDLIDSRRRNTQVQTFTSYVALRQYTKREARYFPLVVTKRQEDGVLKVLLRKMR